MIVRWPRVLTPAQLSQILRKQKNPLTALSLFKEAESRYTSYKHNGPVYATMIGILGNSGRLAEMRTLINDMKDNACECKDYVFAAAIKTYASHGLLDEAMSLFKSLEQFNCINRTESFSTLLQILVKESKLEAAYNLFLENTYGWGVKSRIKSLKILMEFLCRRGHSELALHVFQEMNFQSCDPDRESYQILMKGLCGDGRIEEAIHLLYSMFWRISQKGSGEDIIIYRTLLNALCDNGQVEQAVEILGKILRKGLKAPKCHRHRLDLSQLDDLEDREAIKRLLNEALIRGAVPSLPSYSAMAIDLYNEGKIGEADMVVDHMQSKGFKPKHSIYEAKMRALCGEGRVDDALNVIEKETVEANCVPSVGMYKIAMRGLCDEGKATLARQYLKNMAKQVGCVADQESYGILVDGLCHGKRYLEASQVLEEMLIKSYWPCRQTYIELINGLCSIGRQFEAVMWMEQMISQGMLPDLSVWVSLVSLVCRETVGNGRGLEGLILGSPIQEDFNLRNRKSLQKREGA